MNKKGIDCNAYKEYALKRLKFWDIDCDETKYYVEGGNLIAENNIAECLMIHKKNEWKKIKGGKYTRFDANYKYPNNECVKDLPLCHCGLPCDIRKNNEKNYLFFRCAKKNMWAKFKEDFEIEEESCLFYMEYTKDRHFRLELKQKDEYNSKKLKELLKNSCWLKNIEIYEGEDYGENGCVKCGESRLAKLLTMYNEKLRLCIGCFINKNDELSKEYKFVGKCLIKL